MKLFNKEYLCFINSVFLALSLNSASDSNFKITNNTGKKIYISIGNSKFSPMMMSFVPVLANETYTNVVNLKLKPQILISTETPESGKTTVLSVEFSGGKNMFLDAFTSDQYIKGGIALKALPSNSFFSRNVSDKDITQKPVLYKKEYAKTEHTRGSRPWYILIRELMNYEVDQNTVEPELILGFRRNEILQEENLGIALDKLSNRLKQFINFWDSGKGIFVKTDKCTPSEAFAVLDIAKSAGTKMFENLKNKYSKQGKVDSQIQSKIDNLNKIIMNLESLTIKM